MDCCESRGTGTAAATEARAPFAHLPPNRRYHRRMNDHDRSNDRGPEGTQFLQLELSRWLEGQGRDEGHGIVRELLKRAIAARLEERLGERIAALGTAIADEIADDFEANLLIEAQIDARRDAKKSAIERAQSALRSEGKKSKKAR